MLLDHQSRSAVPDRIGFPSANGGSAVGGKAVARRNHIQYADLRVGGTVNGRHIAGRGNGENIGAGNPRRFHRSAVAGSIGLLRIVLIERGQAGLGQPDIIARVVQGFRELHQSLRGNCQVLGKQLVRQGNLSRKVDGFCCFVFTNGGSL